MHSITVKDVMIPLAEYATISPQATLYQAVLTLEGTYSATADRRHRHRALLVYDEEERIVGKLDHHTVLQALEPKFHDVGDVSMLTRFGLGPSFLRNITRDFALLQNPLDDICRKAAQIRVHTIMQQPTKGEFVEEDLSLNEAIHLFVLGRHQSLLATSNGAVTGVLRLSDVFQVVLGLMKKCEMPG